MRAYHELNCDVGNLKVKVSTLFLFFKLHLKVATYTHVSATMQYFISSCNKDR